MTPEERIRAAKRLWNDPLFQTLMQELVDDTMREWAFSEDPKKREECWFRQRALTLLSTDVENLSKK